MLIPVWGSEHDLKARFFLSTMWAVVLNLNHRLDGRDRYPQGHPFLQDPHKALGFRGRDLLFFFLGLK